MTFDFYEKNFRKKAFAAGYSEEDILKCLAYAQPLVEKKLPIIYNTANLGALVGYRKNYIKRAVHSTKFFYREFPIKKKSGGIRYLKEPLPSLKEIQIWVLKNILYEVPVSKFAKAYVPNRNILDNVRFHRSKNKLLSLDIRNFFPSIKRSEVEQIFSSLGYSSNVSNLLSKLCCCDEVLPQGAPTSAYLSNIYLRDFDAKIAEFCLKEDIRYTRYADDLIFSGDFEEAGLIRHVKNNLRAIDLNLNEDKIKIMLPSDQQIVTGIIVNQIIQIPKNKRKEIRQEIFYIKKFGLAGHLQKTANDRANYIAHLIGKINYAIYINPKDTEMLGYKKYINDTFNFEPKAI